MRQGLSGLRGQSMGGPRLPTDYIPALLALPLVATAGSGSITPERACRAVIMLWGGGASGAANSGGASSGGGGGAFVLKVVTLAARATLTYAVGAGAAGVSADAQGNDGGDTTVTLPGGQVLRAGGGKAGATGAAPGGAGGKAIGGDLNRDGGAGGDGSLSGGSAGGSPRFGGAGGAAGGNHGGGGASAGQDDNHSTLDGGAGRVVIVLIEVR